MLLIFLISLIATQSVEAIDTDGIQFLKNEKFRRPAKKIIFQPESKHPGDYESSCLDGIRYWFTDSKNELSNIVVTDLSLLKNKTPSFKSLLEKHINSLACMDNVRTNFGTVKNVERGKFDELEVFLSSTAQDIGPFPPNELVILGRKGTRIYLMWEYLEAKEYRIESCLKTWKPLTAKGEEIEYGKLAACYQKAFETDLEKQTILRKRAVDLLSVLKD